MLDISPPLAGDAGELGDRSAGPNGRRPITQFEAIHPFTDGNGRTGRVLNTLFLVEQGLSRLFSLPILYPSSHTVAHRAEYCRLLVLTRSQSTPGYGFTFPPRSIRATNGGVCLDTKRAICFLPFNTASAICGPVAFLARITTMRAACFLIDSSSGERKRMFLSFVNATHRFRPTSAIHASSGAFSGR